MNNFVRKSYAVKTCTVAALLVFVGNQAGCLGMLGNWVRGNMTPKISFAAFQAQGAPHVPAAPDYQQPAAWSALPNRLDAADFLPTGIQGIDQQQAPADVFYIHPTSYVGDAWNARIDDPELNQATDDVATRIQASAFNGCCAVYAPRYRQANGTAFTTATADGAQAIDFAYRDIEQAFTAFLHMRTQGRKQEQKQEQEQEQEQAKIRPFIVASHSQGSILAARLITEHIIGTPLESAWVAGYVIGSPQKPIQPCHLPHDLHCLVSFNARSDTYQITDPEHDFEMLDPVRRDDTDLLCTNPLSWRRGKHPAGKYPESSSAYVSQEHHQGAVFLEKFLSPEEQKPRPRSVDAQCLDGILRITTPIHAPRDLPSQILDAVLGEGNYHPIEYQLFFMDIRTNAQTRVNAWYQQQQQDQNQQDQQRDQQQ